MLADGPPSPCAIQLPLPYVARTRFVKWVMWSGEDSKPPLQASRRSAFSLTKEPTGTRRHSSDVLATCTDLVRPLSRSCLLTPRRLPSCYQQTQAYRVLTTPLRWKYTLSIQRRPP